MDKIKIWDDYDKIKNMNDFEFNEMINLEWQDMKRKNPEFCQGLEDERNKWFENVKKEYYAENDDMKKVEIKIREMRIIYKNTEMVYNRLGTI